MDLEKLFTNIYEKQSWGKDISSEFSGNSGGGSNLIDQNTQIYIPFIKNFIKTKNINSVTDLGCGDFRCGEIIYNDLNVEYYGYDIYTDMITHHQNKYKDKSNYHFQHLNIIEKKEIIQISELCIIKDVLQHLPNSCIYTLLDYLQDKFKYIIIVNTTYQSYDDQDTTNNNENNIKIFRGLKHSYLPLKKYNPKLLLNYGLRDDPKEICLITPEK
jgi:hypothetical protein